LQWNSFSSRQGAGINFIPIIDTFWPHYRQLQCVACKCLERILNIIMNRHLKNFRNRTESAVTFPSLLFLQEYHCSVVRKNIVPTYTKIIEGIYSVRFFCLLFSFQCSYWRLNMNSKYSRRSFIQKSKHRKHPNNIIIEGRFGIVVPKATTAVSNFLTTCAVVDGSLRCVESWCFKALNCNSIYIVLFMNRYCIIIYIYIYIIYLVHSH
jgi:hypothetical protein